MKKALLIFSAIASTTAVLAQDAKDVLRYSFLNPATTARSIGFGNTLGSVGGDFGSLSVNPAGIGVYRRGELMLTPSIKVNSVNSGYLNTDNPESSSRFNFNNIGIVFTRAPRGKRYDNSAWKSVSFGFGLNRLADFNRNYSYNGLMKGTGDNYSSYSETYVNDALQYPGELDYNLGFQSYLVNQDNNGNYFTNANWETGLNQTRYVEERGGMSEILFSFGGNYQEKLMLGATVSLPTINYRRESYFQETDATNDPTNYFQAFRATENLQTSGMGFTLKLGAIYKTSDNFRLGAAIHTPTWLVLSDIYDNSITSNTETFKQESGLTDVNPVTTVTLPQGSFDYSIRTPWRGILSATGIIGKHGFITADYEYVDYRSARLNFYDADYSQQESIGNDDVRRLYRATSNIRVGAEARLDQFFIRGGFGFYGSPFQSTQGGTNRINISAGVGYRNDHVFADIGFMHTRFDETETAYMLPAPYLSPQATLQNRMNNIAFTVGFKM